MPENSYFRQGTENIYYLPRQKEVRCEIPEREWKQLKRVVAGVQLSFPWFLSAGFCLLGIAATSLFTTLTIATSMYKTACWAVFGSALAVSTACFGFALLRKSDRAASIKDVLQYLGYIEAAWAAEERLQEEPTRPLFADPCETADGWEIINQGRVTATTNCPNTTRPCLRKHALQVIPAEPTRN